MFHSSKRQGKYVTLAVTGRPLSPNNEYCELYVLQYTACIISTDESYKNNVMFSSFDATPPSDEHITLFKSLWKIDDKRLKILWKLFQKLSREVSGCLVL